MSAALCAVADCLEVFVGATTLLQLNDLEDTTATPATPVTGATVEAVVLDEETGLPVTGIPNPLPMPETPALSANYQGEIPAAASVTAGQRLRITITATSGATVRPFVVLASGVPG